ncbi:MAG: ArsR family transcriptional regulator [Nitriliruptor sp.]|uniref:ArsR family transcriptional regulator n=1 Tax=Nitriliruptor sp. TaxID=2448056 RepID=UPI0034A082B3
MPRASDGAPFPDGSTLDGFADVLGVLGMSRRLRILRLFLEVDDTLCGCEIADVLELEDYQVSRDLAALRRAGLVTTQERIGTWVHYGRVDQPDPTLERLLAVVAGLPLERPVRDRLGLRLEFRERAGCVLGVGDPEVIAALETATSLPVLD